MRPGNCINGVFDVGNSRNQASHRFAGGLPSPIDADVNAGGFVDLEALRLERFANLINLVQTIGTLEDGADNLARSVSPARFDANVVSCFPSGWQEVNRYWTMVGTDVHVQCVGGDGFDFNSESNVVGGQCSLLCHGFLSFALWAVKVLFGTVLRLALPCACAYNYDFVGVCATLFLPFFKVFLKFFCFGFSSRRRLLLRFSAPC